MKYQFKPIFLLLSFLWMGVSVLKSQENNVLNTLTLQQCLELAQKNNTEIKNATVHIQKTRQTTNTYLAKIFPKLTGNVDYRYNTEIPVTVIPGEVFGAPKGTFQEVRFGVAQTFNAGVTLDQILYNHAAFIALRAIKPIREQSVLQAEEVKETVLFNVSATFYNIQIVEKQIELIENNLTSLKKLADMMQLFVQQNISPENEFIKIKLRLDALYAQSLDAKLNKQKMYNMLKLLIGLPMHESLKINPESMDNLTKLYVPASIPEVSHLRQTKIQQINIDLLKVDKVAALNAFMPSMFLRANYNVAGNNNEFNPFRSIQDRWPTSSFVSLGIKIPLFDGLESIYTRKAKDFEAMMAKNNFATYQQDILRKLKDSYEEYEVKKEIEITKKNIYEAQQKLSNDESRQFELGITNLTNLIKAQDEATLALTDYISSLIELKKSELNYKKLTNTIITP